MAETQADSASFRLERSFRLADLVALVTLAVSTGVFYVGGLGNIYKYYTLMGLDAHQFPLDYREISTLGVAIIFPPLSHLYFTCGFSGG
jgi:hypothetical protein